MDPRFEALARHVIEPDASPSRRALLETLAGATLRRALAAALLERGLASRPPADPRAALAPAVVLRVQWLRRFAGKPPAERAMLRALLETAPGRSLGRAPGAPATLVRARRLLKTAWPAQALQTSWYVRRVVTVGPGGFEGTVPDLPGLVFLRSGRSWFEDKLARPDERSPREAGLAELEFLLHESAHQQLLLLGRAFPLWEAARVKPVSPWSGRPIPALALPAALHAYWITGEGLRRAGAGGERRARLAAGFTEGFRLARRHLKPTPEGRRFLGLLEARVRRG